MLRGVNRRIIEVSDTGSDYFEKALFFVKGTGDLNTEKLEREAQRIMVSYFNNEEAAPRQGYLRYTDNRKRKLRRVAIMSAAALVAVILAAVVVILQF